MNCTNGRGRLPFRLLFRRWARESQEDGAAYSARRGGRGLLSMFPGIRAGESNTIFAREWRWPAAIVESIPILQPVLGRPHHAAIEEVLPANLVATATGAARLVGRRPGGVACGRRLAAAEHQSEFVRGYGGV